MSNPGTEAEQPSPTLIEQAGDLPETVTQAEPIEEAPEQPEAEKPAVEAAQESEKPKRTPWYQTRIDEITKARREAERKASELEARLAKLETSDEADPSAPIKPENFEALIEQRAEQIIARRAYEQRSKGWFNAGVKEYTADRFNQACADVAAMGAGDSPAFMQIITDPDIIQDGHKIVMSLAENPDEAERILSFKDDPTKLAAALTKFAVTASTKPPETPISKAPAPIRPIGGAAKSTVPSDADDIRDWMAKRNQTARTTAGGQANRN